MRRRNAMWAATLPLVGLLGSAILLDLLFAVSTSKVFLGAVAALGVLVTGAVGALWRRPECLALLTPFAAILTLLPYIDTSALKPFGRFYAAIQPGMTEADVLKALDVQFPPAGRYPRPLVSRRIDQTHLGFILDPNNGRYNAEIVSVDCESGRVVRKLYLPD